MASNFGLSKSKIVPVFLASVWVLALGVACQDPPVTSDDGGVAATDAGPDGGRPPTADAAAIDGGRPTTDGGDVRSADAGAVLCDVPGYITCGATCDSTGESCAVGCAAPLRCLGGECRCPGHFTLCDGECVQLAVDRRHCGACGAPCGLGAVCRGGTCVCPAGTTVCGSGCFELDRDPANCGTCGTSCADGESCVEGVCIDSTGGCADTQSDPFNCGSCGRVCLSGRCELGACAPCPTGTLCGGVCTDLDTNPSHCGACDSACPSGRCRAGSCDPCTECLEETGEALCADIDSVTVQAPA